MEMTVCFLLLLLCSPSTAQLQSRTDKHITAPGEQTEGQTADASIQEQIRLQDLHTILRELSTSVAEQRVEMWQLQRKNEAQEAKLESQRAEVERQKQKLEAQEAKLESQKAEVERQKQKNEAQEAKLESQRAEVERQKQKNEAQEAKLRELESQRAEVEKLKQNLEAQATELISMKSRTNVTEHQVEALRRDGEVKQVAFSASLRVSGEVTLGPFNTDTNLVFKHVFSNIGNAYSPVTGVFTAPVRGAYHFEVYIGAGGHANHGSGAVLLKNGEQVFVAWERQNNGYGSSANGATLLLEVGDVVSMQLRQNTRILDNENHLSTFSGHLLFTM